MSLEWYVILEPSEVMDRLSSVRKQLRSLACPHTHDLRRARLCVHVHILYIHVYVHVYSREQYILYIPLKKKRRCSGANGTIFPALFYCRLSAVLPTRVTVEMTVSINTGVYAPFNSMIEQVTSLQL